MDYDGTLATDDRPHPEAMAALAGLRSGGRKLVLVTGRILTELRAVFPDVDDRFDLIVAENGAVLTSGGVHRTLAPPVPQVLDAALRDCGIPFRRGEVLLAREGADEVAVLEELSRLQLECQLVRNRASLMVLPAAVSKGSGPFEGLGDLGVSHHNTIAIGDAENDHSLLDVAELGVAVAEAVDALKAHADVTLDVPGDAGLTAFLTGPIVAGLERVHPRRWRLRLGTLADGTVVSIPASQLNVLVAGSSRRGKSYIAGLIAEQLIGLGYSVLVVDPEGDHVGLGQLRGVLAVGGDGRLPSPAELVDLLRYRFGSVVVDLSAVSLSERAAFLQDAPSVVEQHRALTGLPHWVIIDEAQDPLGRESAAPASLRPAITGYCFVTHRAQDLCAEALLAADLLIVLPTGFEDDPTIDLAAAAAGMSREAAAGLLKAAAIGQAMLIDRRRTDSGLVFTIGQRHTAHARHWHKYSAGRLPPERRFHFRGDWDTATGVTAGNIEDLEHELRICERDVVSHHCQHGDFSRWILDVLGDPVLAASVGDIEATVSGSYDAELGRAQLLKTVHSRWPDSPQQG